MKALIATMLFLAVSVNAYSPSLQVTPRTPRAHVSSQKPLFKMNPAPAHRAHVLTAMAPRPGVGRVVGFFSGYATLFTILLVRTLSKFPLIPPSPSSLAWNSAWLVTTVVDYYGAAFALCGIIIASESRRVKAQDIEPTCSGIYLPFHRAVAHRMVYCGVLGAPCLALHFAASTWQLECCVRVRCDSPSNETASTPPPWPCGPRR